MARRNVYIEMSESGHRLWFRTDLKGRGPVHFGDEFTAQECYTLGTQRLVRRGIKMRVRVTRIVPLTGRLDLLCVEILERMK